MSIQDIPEADIVRLVSYICASDPENTRSRLSLILQYRYSDVFLTRALTSLKVEEVQYLVIILISMFEQIGEGFDLENDTLTESDLIQFIICLIDAQVSSLLLVPELHEPLQQLSKMVRSHVDACSSIETLRSIITDCHRESKKYHKGDMKSFGEFDSYTIDTINW